MLLCSQGEGKVFRKAGRGRGSRANAREYGLLRITNLHLFFFRVINRPEFFQMAQLRSARTSPGRYAGMRGRFF